MRKLLKIILFIVISLLSNKAFGQCIKKVDKITEKISWNSFIPLSKYCGDIDERDKYGNTILHQSVLAGNIYMVEDCLKKRANPFVPCLNGSAIEMICFPNIGEPLTAFPKDSIKKTNDNVVQIIRKFRKYLPEYDSIITNLCFRQAIIYRAFAGNEKIYNEILINEQFIDISYIYPDGDNLLRKAIDKVIYERKRDKLIDSKDLQLIAWLISNGALLEP